MRALHTVLPVLGLALVPSAMAQLPCGTSGVDASVSPSVAAVGQPMSVTLANNSGAPIVLPTSCVFGAVFPGSSCSGSPVFTPICLQVLTSIPSGTSRTMSWNQTDNSGLQVPAGSYSFSISYFDAAGALVGCCVTGTISSAVGTAYCFGGIACPCGNTDAAAGCANSTSMGALLSSAGSASVSSDDLVLTVTNVPAGQNGLVYMGGAASQVPFGDGLRCVASGPFATCRFPTRNAGASGTLTEGPGIVAFSLTLGAACHVDVGETWFFQGWYRDPGGPCGAFFNLSNALSVTFAP